MRKRLSLLGLGSLALACFALGAACGNAGDSSNGGCVDFTIEPSDLSCDIASDCTFVSSLHLCPGDPSCGYENPVNQAGAARYAVATKGVPLEQVACGAPSPIGCVNHVCAIVGFESGAGSDAGTDGA